MVLMEDSLELIGQIIDVFEDFLAKKGISLDNPEKEQSDDSAIIYGSDYDNLSNDLNILLENWDIISNYY